MFRDKKNFEDSTSSPKILLFKNFGTYFFYECLCQKWKRTVRFNKNDFWANQTHQKHKIFHE